MNDASRQPPQWRRPPEPQPEPARLPVPLWPGAPPSFSDGLCVIAVRTDDGQQRARARQQIRLALRDALAGLLDIPADTIALSSTPGRAPHIIVAGSDAGGARDIGCSISHESGLSLAAINLRGAVGVDLMRVRGIADWEVVARDYLGAEVARTLAETAPGQRAAAFARAWTAREAGLKYLGLELREWTPAPLPCRRL